MKILWLLLLVSLFVNAEEPTDDAVNNNTFVDTEGLPSDDSMVSNYFYVGAWMGLLRSPPSMDAISPVWYVSPYWGSDWNEDFSFEGAIYSYKFYEDLYTRPNHSGDPARIYEEKGVKLRYLEFLSEKKYMRLRPLFEVSDVVLPYFAVGLQIEPSIHITDPNLELIQYYDTSHWGAGINLAFGWLHLIRNTDLRIRYEIGMDNNYNPLKNSKYIKSIWTEPYMSLGLEYSFSVKDDYKPAEAQVYASFDAYAPNQFDKEAQASASADQKYVDELAAATSFEAKAHSKQNLIKKNNYSLMMASGTSDLDRSVIDKIQKITHQYRRDKEYDRYYKIYSVSPKPNTAGKSKKEQQADEKEQLALTRKRAVLITDFMINGGVKPENIVYSWKLVDRVPDNMVYGKYDYVIVEEYVYEKSGSIRINKSTEVAKLEASRIKEREDSLEPQADGTIVKEKRNEDLNTSEIDKGEKIQKEEEMEIASVDGTSRWVLPNDQLKQGGGSYSAGTKVKTEPYKSSTSYEGDMQPDKTGSVQSVDKYGNYKEEAPESMSSDLGSGIYFKHENTPPTQDIKGDFKYTGEKEYIISVDKKTGDYDDSKAILAIEDFLVLESDGYKMYIDYWFSDRVADGLDDNVFFYTQISGLIGKAESMGVSESDIRLSPGQTPSLKSSSNGGQVYVMRVRISK